MGQPGAWQFWHVDNGKRFLISVDDLLNKSVDHVVIDLSDATKQQQQKILDHLANRAKESPEVKKKVDDVIIIGGD